MRKKTRKVVKDDTAHKQLLEYRPVRNAKSGILSDLQISNIVSKLPTFMRMSKWERIFKMDEDGCSLITFFKRCREWDTTVLVIEDQRGWVFGCIAMEAWRPMFDFYGNGDNMLFTFKDKQDIEVYNWTGEGDQH